MALAVQLVIYGLTNGAVVALNAVGFTIAYAVARQINLAHGSVFAFTTVVVTSVAVFFGLTASSPLHLRIVALLLLAIFGALVGALLNVGVERLAFRPFRRAHDRQGPLVASVGLSFVLFQAGLWWHQLFLTLPMYFVHIGVILPLLAMPDLVPRVELLGGGVSFTLKDGLLLALAALVAGGVALLLARTRAGRLLRAVAQDPELTSLVGGDVERAQTLAFALAGALAGFGAAIFTAYYGGTSGQFGLQTGLAAMTAAVLGGVGDPGGALVAGLLLGIFGAFSDFYLDAAWTPVLVLGLLVLLLAFRPNGVLAPARVEAVDEPGSSLAATLPSRGDVGGSRWLLGALLALALVYPVLDALGNWNRLPSVSSILLLVSLGVGLSIVVGFAGLLDLGYAAFFAIGGYTAAMLTSSGSYLALALPPVLRQPWAMLPLAGLVAAGFGILFGLPTIRTRGEYLAIVTLAFGVIVPGVIWHLPYWTGGPNGLSGVPLPRLLPLEPGSPLHAYLLALALVVVGCLVALRLGGSRTGRAWAAVRDDDVAADAVGVYPAGAKLLAFAIGAGVAGVTGAVYAGQLGYIEPGQFDLTLSLMVLAAVLIGGRWGIAGVVLGALTVAAYDRLLADLVTDLVHGLGSLSGLTALASLDLRTQNYLMFGVALYVAILFRTRGIPDAATSPSPPAWRRSRIAWGRSR
ncbi:MAG: ABC transporter permease [Chloroflexi bacterium]|nr:ABC transporter permease [Chloroflexota bacterium]